VQTEAILVRAAHVGDGPAIHSLVAGFAQHGALLPRSQAEVEASIADWVVVEEGGHLLACGSLLSYTAVLAEIRSLAVAPDAQGRGLGSSIVEALIDLARRRGIGQVFALTRAVPFFTKLGFDLRPGMPFPEKVWRDCQLCPLQEHCDETAVVKTLSSDASAAGKVLSVRQKGNHHV
jgi:amino-acid N-acetyltransferase